MGNLDLEEGKKKRSQRDTKGKSARHRGSSKVGHTEKKEGKKSWDEI